MKKLLLSVLVLGAINVNAQILNSNLESWTVTKTPSGGNTIYDVTEGWLYVDGELAYFAGGSIESFNDDVVWFEIESTMIGNDVQIFNAGTDKYHEQRVAILKDGNTIPSSGISVDAPTVNERILELSNAFNKNSITRSSALYTANSGVYDSTTAFETLLSLTPSSKSFNQSIIDFNCTIETTNDSATQGDSAAAELYVGGTKIYTHNQTIIRNGEDLPFTFRRPLSYVGNRNIEVKVKSSSGLVIFYNAALIFDGVQV